jgi:hypothetical protein
MRLWRDFLAEPYWSYRSDVAKRALVTYSLPGKTGNLYRFDGGVRLRPCRPWHGNGTSWQRSSRVGTPDALWVYWLTDGQAPGPAAASESEQRAA